MLYALIGFLVGTTAGRGTALISANQPYLQASLGLYENELAWLPAVYVMSACSEMTVRRPSDASTIVNGQNLQSVSFTAATPVLPR